jgi:2-isopropylmalate synthase
MLILALDSHRQAHRRGTGQQSETVSYVELRVDHGSSQFGVGIASDTIKAQLLAILNAMNRAAKNTDLASAA